MVYRHGQYQKLVPTKEQEELGELLQESAIDYMIVRITKVIWRVSLFLRSKEQIYQM